MGDDGGSGGVGRTLAGGGLLGGVAAGVMAAWAWANDRPECSGETFACLGEAVMVLLIGVPAALTLAWLGLWTLGMSNPVLAVGLTFLVGSLGSSALDAPLWFWPAAIGAVGCVLNALLGARAGQAT